VHHRDEEIELRIIFASRGHSCLSLSNIALYLACERAKACPR